MSVSYLRDVLKSEKLYIRPLQRDIDPFSIERGGSEDEVSGMHGVSLLQVAECLQ